MNTSGIRRRATEGRTRINTRIGKSLVALGTAATIAFGIATPASASVVAGGGTGSAVLGCGATGTLTNGRPMDLPPHCR